MVAVKRLVLLVALVLSVVLSVMTVPAHAAPGTIHVVSAKRDSDRVLRYLVSTPSLEMSSTTPLRIDVILPDGYRQHPDRRYPVLYALPGTSQTADSWLDQVHTLRMTRDLGLIVVAPDGTFDGDGGGFYTNWVDQGTSRGVADWETFHVRELVPWVDAHFRTVAARTGRAITGISQGGFGSMSYAARHPGLFGAAASFSGAVDIYQDPVCETGATALISTIMTGLNNVQPFAPFGDPATDGATWAAHDPGSLVANLAHTQVDVFTSEGAPGESDLSDPSMAAGAGLEAMLHVSNLCFKEAADAAGIDYGWHSYPVGLHTAPYMNRALRTYLPILMRYFRSHGH